MSFRASESLSEQIAQHLAQQIIMGDLVEGERIQELRIAKELNVSRGSVREALLVLARKRLIEIYPRRGAVVSEMSPVQVKALYEVLSMLLQMICRKASENWRQHDMEGFVGQLQRLQSCVDEGDIEGFHEGAFEFFNMAYRFANNSYASDILDDLQPAVRRAAYLALHTDRRELDEALAFLKGVVDSIMMRKSEQAASLIDDFCVHQRNLVLDALLRVKQIEVAWAQRHRR
ncbi:MAG: GntR family transcriptional regulator [Moraxellaceae bacterium]|nr:GntR family transcriptional regulator [Moraxellaceae bacterium]